LPSSNSVSRPKREVLHPVTARAFLAALDRERRKYVSATPVNYLAENRSKLISTNDLLDVWGGTPKRLHCALYFAAPWGAQNRDLVKKLSIDAIDGRCPTKVIGSHLRLRYRGSRGAGRGFSTGPVKAFIPLPNLNWVLRVLIQYHERLIKRFVEFVRLQVDRSCYVILVI
jgi:hypothetical protein